MKQLSDFEQWFAKAQNNEDQQLEFVWALMKSPYVEYHYALMTDKTLTPSFRTNLQSRFKEHGEAGELFLLSKLDNNEDADAHAEIIFTLGLIQGQHKDRTLQHARQMAVSADSYVRNRAIIVIGWLGSPSDVPLLADRLLNDTDSKCRAWASTAFMQMWFRRKSTTLVKKALPVLLQGIQHEGDYFALGCIILTVQELAQKKFGLSQRSVDEVNVEKINAAKAKAERYLVKALT